MGRYRTINVDLNRQYRNDLNKNFEDIERDISKSESEIARVEADSKERDNLIAGTNVEDIINRINTTADNADVQAQHAKTQGYYAKSQGDYAKGQGEYAQSKGNYANEKAILADEAAANANSEASNLSQLKIEVTTATQNANTVTSEANTATINANNSATYATAQGDYAKQEADRVAGMDVGQITEKIGELTELQTDDKTNLVEAVNEVDSNLTSLQQKVTKHLVEYAPTDISLFISSVNGNDSNDGLTQQTAIASINKLTDLLNAYKSINSITINVQGDFERIELYNYSNIITIKSLSSTVKSKFKVTAYNCRDIRVINAECVTNAEERLLAFYDVNKVIITQSTLQPISGGIGVGIHLSGVSNFLINSCRSNYLRGFLETVNSFGIAESISGSDINVGYSSFNGSRLTVLNNALSANTLVMEVTKGEVRI